MNDNEEKKKPFKDFIRKIKSVKNIEIIVCIILIAIILLLYGIVREAKKQAESGNAGATIVETASDEERLAAVLSKIKGAGKVEVYIGYDGNFETVYAFDKTKNTTTRTDDSGGANLTTTVTEEKSTAVFDENKKPLIEKTVAPKITGVIVVAEGAKDVAVRLNILKAVATALNVNEKIIEIFIMN
jgi:stage III sporulation protein AG